ncbi:MAG: calcineurin-like phosphoesterase family protein [Paraglaciecola sp.]|jgi:calcineurin-like phosphoesterase family protein
MTNMNTISFKYLLNLFVLSLLLQSCESNNQEENSYSFFVAGHTYGNPNAKNLGLYPPFVAKFDGLNQQDKLQLGILTGDIVRAANEKSWIAVWEELRNLNAKIHIAGGNHDVSNKQLFKKYVPESYYAFQQNEDLFLILDPNIDHWNISEEQLIFFKEQILNAHKYRHIFMFAHQLIWWQEDAKWATCQPNSFQNKSDTLNFQSEILPLLESVENQVFLFAGDVGAVPNSPAICYLKKGNVSMIASGMGVDAKDNFLLVKVGKNEEIEIELVGLKNKDIGRLEDYLKEI